MTNLLTYNETTFLDRLYIYEGMSDKLVNMICAAHWETLTRSHFSAIDRTDSNQLLNVEPIPIPTVTGNPGELRDLMLERAAQLWKTNPNISVLWSGGLDSTGVIVALILTNDRWYENLQILVTNESSHPKFMNDIIIPSKVDVQLLEGNEIVSRINNSRLFVTGELGDLIAVKVFDDDKVNHSLSQEFPLDKFIDGYFDYMLSKLNTTLERKDCVMLKNFYSNRNKAKTLLEDWFYNHLKKSPVEIKDTYKAFWWIKFSLRWHERRYKYVRLTGDLETQKNQTGFFDTDDFQRWSIYQYGTDEIVNKQHKLDLRKFIEDFSKDEEYTKNTVSSGMAPYFNDATVLEKAHYVDSNQAIEWASTIRHDTLKGIWNNK